MKKFIKIFLSAVGVILILSGIAYFFSRDRKSDMIIGVSFQADYARYLGLDHQAVFTTVLDQWQFRHIRLTAQWDNVEKTPGQFDFAELDWLMDEAEKRDAKIIMAVGQKTPRWPECHAPGWTANLDDERYFGALHNYIATVVQRYRNHSALEIWQVENEPFLSFGEKCRTLSGAEFKKEISNVRALDNAHQILTADSGELSTWWRTARVGDLFGTTLYRMVWNKYLGYWSYDWLSPTFYRFKLWLTGQSVDNAFVVELQAEPWIPGGELTTTVIEEQDKSMNLERLKGNLDYARRLQFSRSYLWGAEWWYWLSEHEYNEIPNFIRDLPKN